MIIVIEGELIYVQLISFINYQKGGFNSSLHYKRICIWGRKSPKIKKKEVNKN